jgi:hypothetical protein
MKLKSILAAALVLMSAVTFANDANINKLVVVRGQESGIFKVIFEGKDQVNATVTVLDVTGTIVFTENINGKNGFILPMNFKGLRSGEYTIEVKHAGNTLVETINYTAYTKIVEPSTIQNVHVAKLSNNGKYLLSVSKSGNEPISISVFNTMNELVHFETRRTEGDFAVVYDITAFPGVSKFEITGNAGYSAVIKK